ncbi:aminoacyl-tRNA hydrolase, partial [Patescibacteria group bacterium]
MYLIIGLGNPGINYEKTRHNVGFAVIGEIIDKYNLKLKNYPKFQSYIAKTEIADQKIILAMPLTYMNNSGLAVSRLANFYKLNPENIIIIHDDIDLPFRKIRINFNSS